MNDNEEVKVSVSKLCKVGFDAYSRPLELIPIVCIDAIALYSSRGTIPIDKLELIISKYIKLNPKSAEVLNIFMKTVQRDCMSR